MLNTSKKIVTATLGQLVAEARAKGIQPYKEGGKKTYMLEIDDQTGAVKIGRAKVESKETAVTLEQLIEAAKATGVKPRKDKGKEYMTLEFDLTKGLVEVVTTTDADLKTGKAISPKRGA